MSPSRQVLLKQVKFHSLSPEETLTQLESSDSGLSSEEAKRRLKIFGENKIQEGKGTGRFRIFFDQLRNPLIFILIIAAGITAALGDYKDSLFIVAAALVNISLGFYQENKAELALAALKSYITERVLVFRDGQEREIDTAQLIPGDVIRLNRGAKIPADARILFENDTRVDESVLTGESLPERKTSLRDKPETSVVDQSAMVFAGTTLVQGTLRAVITATGDRTEIGKIAKLVGEGQDTETPLKRALSKFTARASYVILLFAGLMFCLTYWSGVSLLESFLISVAILVAAVPEGLPIVMTVILAIGVQRLARRNGVVRKLSAAETLGSTSVILTDKTGTLTEAKMELAEVRGFFDDGEKPEINVEEFILSAALFNTDVVIENPGNLPAAWQVIGKSLEVSLVKEAAKKYQLCLPDIKDRYSELVSLPFNSKNKYSASAYESNLEIFQEFFGKKNLRIVSLLGAPELLIEKTTFSKDKKEEVLSLVESMASDGSRVVAVAFKSIARNSGSDKIALAEDDNLDGFRVFGLLAFRDPIREGVSEALARISAGGVRTVIVTGDHTGTAMAVARELGIEVERTEVMDGKILDGLSEEELKQRLGNLKIVSRVSPEGKMKLARAFQASGEVVAMTGDGVNDAPALKQADIGVAMGSGTDVARGVADLVLLDDNYTTIVEAILEGRRIVNNIRKALVYLGSTVFDEVLLIGGSLLLGFAIPLNALQILWINFFTDSFPGISLAFEEKIDDLEHRPSTIKDGLLTKNMKILLFINGLVGALLVLGLYAWMLGQGYEEILTRTVVFAAFSSYSLFLVFAVRSLKKSVVSYNPFSNTFLLMSVVFGLAMIAIAIYIPFFQTLFGTVALSANWIMLVVAFGILNILVIEISKALFTDA
ncbi:MAG: hypothetical protein COU09_00180 [Candidatus Harrisonbacteria bacterium CG10_big_fil_rev_8_21_14_0_10_44_23]|uniref:Cation-transporting P-type ATPase N-terminal domain-containing protein n=1 Tax=Candidatus Harrisonbacteria bacterium CG10_big_fil_rev_8_21_14_0_10_44_23 TaxID=1974585 RepID=A0A2H0UR18_9BACT|nr:MAG: hypothetical protein COU09_00180 [Candidatus Harrisonbacteria bacterium CG10_big_fil_rev_8_21_14_0_10_44_23]